MSLKIRKFLADEEGATTFEALIWFVLMMPILALTFGASFAFQGLPAVTRSIHDGHRLISTGRVLTAAEVETYIETVVRLTYANANATVTIDGNFVDTVVTIPWGDLDLTGFLGFVSAQQVTFAARNRLEWM